jgi:hypothetical protein
VEDGLAPNRRAAAQMAMFDQFPLAYRRFLANYPPPIPPDQAKSLLEACDGRVDEAISEIRAHLPVRRIA